MAETITATPDTNVFTLPTAGLAVEIVLHDKTNKVTIQAVTNAVSWAYTGTDGVALNAAKAIPIVADAFFELRVDEGADRVSGSIFVQPTVNGTTLYVINEEG